MTDESDGDDVISVGGGAEAEINALLGMFDAPAFVRRGADLEYALNRLEAKLRREREGMLDMVRLRLRQWSGVATGPDDFRPTLRSSPARLYELAGADAPAWSPRPASARQRTTVARDLAASVGRFNRRWSERVGGLKLDALNRQIEHYNRYYVLEKECVLGSARLAARHFVPKPLMTPETLFGRFPLLPEPE